MKSYAYGATVEEFINSSNNFNNFITVLTESFIQRIGKKPSDTEIKSWSNSLQELRTVLNNQQYNDCYIFIEFMMPLFSGRIDVLLVGKGLDNQAYTVIIENKQWKTVNSVNVNEDLVNIGYDVTHPSSQINNYVLYLRDYYTPFSNNEVSLVGCGYLHNMANNHLNILKNTNFSHINTYQLFGRDQKQEFEQFLLKHLINGGGKVIADKIINSTYKQSQKLMETVYETITGDVKWNLLNTQLDSYKAILALVKKSLEKNNTEKHAFIVTGGPGTGKSIIAMQLLVDAFKNNWQSYYAIGNFAFRNYMRGRIKTNGNLKMRSIKNRQIALENIFVNPSEIATLGSNRAFKCSYFPDSEKNLDYKNGEIVAHNYPEGQGSRVLARGKNQNNVVNLLIVDEAHRTWDFNMKFYRNEFRKVSDIPMVQEMINIAKVSVFFIDDNQAVRLRDIGTTTYLTEQIELAINKKPTIYELKDQFRCGGSEAYINWVDYCFKYNSVDIDSFSKKKTDFLVDGYDFRICESMEEMQSLLLEKKKKNDKIRYIAGYCWKWDTKKTDRIFELQDPRFGNWKSDRIHKGGQWLESRDQSETDEKSSFVKWLSDDDLDYQIGTAYVSQGMDFDYVGLIFGEDLVIRKDQWIYQPKKSTDTNFKRLHKNNVDIATFKLKNAYRIALTRGIKGTYVFFLDDETHDYFRNNLN